MQRPIRIHIPGFCTFTASYSTQTAIGGDYSDRRPPDETKGCPEPMACVHGLPNANTGHPTQRVDRQSYGGAGVPAGFLQVILLIVAVSD